MSNKKDKEFCSVLLYNQISRIDVFSYLFGLVQEVLVQISQQFCNWSDCVGY